MPLCNPAAANVKKLKRYGLNQKLEINFSYCISTAFPSICFRKWLEVGGWLIS